jgi:2-dehydro-3-deoxyphosphogluconate aldolase/(4S)-4-hydroxy-2-oxoglutarate aldolase
VTSVHISEHDAIAAGKLVPVIALDRAESAPALANALLEGGLRCAEVTFRTEAAADAIKSMADGFPEMLVGAGTVLTVEQVDRAVDAGAKFVVSPGFGPKVVRRCAERGIPIFPGVATASEIQMALDEGITTVKFFPAEQAGGVGMIKALAAPFKQVRFIPTGGVNTKNVADYLAIPAVIAVGGSWMVPTDALKAGDWARVTQLTSEAVKAVAAL